MTSKQTHNRTREDARNCALSFCVYTEREKETTTHKEREDKTKSRSQGSQEDKPRTTKANPQRIGEEDEKGKNRGEHATSHITA